MQQNEKTTKYWKSNTGNALLKTHYVLGKNWKKKKKQEIAGVNNSSKEVEGQFCLSSG